MQKFILVVATILVFALPVLAQEVTQEAKDASITARIESLLVVNRQLSAFEIDTSTKDGVVTLTGGVDDDIQRGIAADLATTVPGVRKVVNRIVVVPDAESAKDRRSFRQALKDKGISTAVRGRLVGKGEFKGLKIGVETINGTTTLSGVVRSDAERAKIVRIAEETAGVQQVYDQLSVVPPEPVDNPMRDVGKSMGDEVTEKRVEKAILLNKHLNSREIDVEVNDGVVILTGSVNTEEERQLAEDITRSLGGVTNVRNELRFYDNVTIFNAAPPEAPATEAPAPEGVQLQDIDPYEDPQVSVETKPLPSR